MASLKPRGAGKWLLRWRAPDPARPGLSVARSKMFTGSRADALREANRIEAEQRGDPLHLEQGKTFGAFMADDWLPWRAALLSLSERTRHQDAEISRVLCRLIGSVKLAAFSARDLDRLSAALHRYGYAPGTVRHYWAAARKALRQARRWRLLSGEPWADARAPTVPRVAIAMTTPDAAEQVAARLDDYNPPAAALVRTMIGTGARKSELLALTIDDLPDDCRAIAIHKTVFEAGRRHGVKLTPKTPSGRRVVALAEPTRQVLLSHRDWIRDRQVALLGWNPEGWLFPDRSGGLWRPTAAVQVITFAARALGLPGGLHILRHAHASALLARGVPVKAVSERLGHSSAAMTLNVYAHTLTGTSDVMLKALGDVLPTPTSPTEPKVGGNVIRIRSARERRNASGPSQEPFVDQIVDQSAGANSKSKGKQ
jgi:integrase